MNKKETVHIISHSHWDREWYLPYESHHMRLVELIDTLLDQLDKGCGFESYFLDGQTIVLDDYLQIKPQNKDRLLKYINEKRIQIGPWYILQDEFLTGSESNIRNLLTGLCEAKKYGEPTMIGYFPDAFGNAGQMPQILKQGGCDAVVFGRGVKPIGFDNQVMATGEFESNFSEMYWASPDGTDLYGILFANWYNNGNEIPVEEEAAKEYWEKRLAGVRKFASGSNYLLMNGCDHQPIQTDLPEAIETARKLYPDIEFIHSNFEDYVKALKAETDVKLTTVTGELTSQETDGWYTLVNTSSSRIYLKQMNRENEVKLSMQAEPLALMDAQNGNLVQKEWFDYAWKTLMQNHPHDSICGCSVDAVNREMATRFEKSIVVADELIQASMQSIADHADTSMFAEGEFPFIVANTTGWDKTGVVDAIVDLEHDHSVWLFEVYDQIKDADITGLGVKDENGNLIDCKIEDLGAVFDYHLPKDKFRQPYMTRRLKVTFEAENVPALGYKVYALCKDCYKNEGSLITAENTMENANAKVVIAEDGSFTLTDKRSGKTLSGLGIYEDTGDVGNEYIFFQPVGTKAITTKGVEAKVSVKEDSAFRAVYEIKHTMMIPESADAMLDYEQRKVLEYNKRKAGRSDVLIPMEITEEVTLEKNAEMVKIKTTFDNKAKDHRVRILFPTGYETAVHKGDSIFEIAVRSNKTADVWQNPSNCQHQQFFASVDDGVTGLTVGNIGLNEYELVEEDTTLAITLLRCTGELGDWGYFPTPEAQCLGVSETEVCVMLHPGDVVTSGAVKHCHQYQSKFLTAKTKIHAGKKGDSYVKWSGDTIVFTAAKEAHESRAKVFRFVNFGKDNCTLTFAPNFAHESIWMSNVVEQKVKELGCGEVKVDVRPHEIVTLVVE